jgi:outer membrane receptor protein involved in Fe transport
MDTTGPLSALPAFLGGNRPRVALIVDGRPTTYSEFVFGAAPLWDVARVEVFRSPQTTTQGQNSIAGAIFVNSNEPSATAEFRARAIVGDFHTRQLSLLGSGPLLGDDVAFRVAGDFRYSRTTSRTTYTDFSERNCWWIPCPGRGCCSPMSIRNRRRLRRSG